MNPPHRRAVRYPVFVKEFILYLRLHTSKQRGEVSSAINAAYADSQINMLQDFFSFYLNKAGYEIIDEGKTYYGEIPELRGVWATGKTLEECRKNLLETLEGWVILRLRKNLPIPNFNIPLKKIPLNNKVYARA